MIAFRVLVRLMLGMRRRSGRDTRTRLLVGEGEAASRYLEAVRRYPQMGLKIVGCLSEGVWRSGPPRLGGFGDIRNTLHRIPVDGVVVALPLHHPATELIVQECELHGTPVEILLDNLTSRLAHSQVIRGMGVPRLALSQISQSSDKLVFKRLTDVVLSFVALVLLSPLFLVVALLIKLDDGGPVFFSQERMGQFGRTFYIHKFRSMSVDAEAMKHKLIHLNEMSGPVFKIAKDPRVTRMGAWLRKTSVDELPQLLNVLVGQMSLVGPRPPLVSEVNQYDAHHRRRLSVKPGITCLWQISGRNTIDFGQWMDLDMAYIDTWSYLQDWKILLKTIPAVLRRRGAS
jgi:exopolysaccharide biosynthesis polyprenyl glycosylphosphotransferase